MTWMHDPEFEPSPGYQTFEQEFESRTRKAFVDNRADHIIIDSKRDKFQMSMVAYGQVKGWFDEGEYDEGDPQWPVVLYRLTPAGKAHFGLKV